jgi:hypothetical protein
MVPHILNLGTVWHSVTRLTLLSICWTGVWMCPFRRFGRDTNLLTLLGIEPHFRDCPVRSLVTISTDVPACLNEWYDYGVTSGYISYQLWKICPYSWLMYRLYWVSACPACTLMISALVQCFSNIFRCEGTPKIIIHIPRNPYLWKQKRNNSNNNNNKETVVSARRLLQNF